MPQLFDPLRYLRVDLQAEASIGPEGIALRFVGRVEAHQRKKALAVARAYEKLLRLQLENGGASVQKLLAWGKIRVVEGGMCWGRGNEKALRGGPGGLC